VKRPLLLPSFPHELLNRLRHLVDLRGKLAQLTGELSRTSGILRRTHGVNSLPQNVHILGKGHQRNEDRRPSFLERVKAGIDVRVFAGRLGNQFFNPCSGSHRDSVGTVRILDGRWSGEYPLMDANPRGGSSSTGDLLPDAELVAHEAEIVSDSYLFLFLFFFESLLTSFDSFPTSFESFLTAVVIVVTCDVRSPNCVASSTRSTAGASAGRELTWPLATTSTPRSSLSISLASWRRPTRQRTETSWRKAMRLVDAASATRACSTIVSIWSSALIRLDTPDTVGPDLHGVLAVPCDHLAEAPWPRGFS
jgi:hypothetical protein